MFIQKKQLVLVALIALLGTLVMSACSSTVTGSNSSNLTVLQVVQKSSDAMKNLKTTHLDLTVNGSVQGSSATPTTSGSNHLNFNVTGSGDQSITDGSSSMKIKVNDNQTLSEIVIGSQVYVQNSKGQWYVIDADKMQGLVGNPFAGVSIDSKTLLALATQAQIIDHGDENVNGTSLRHITAVLDKAALRQLLKSNPQLGSMFGQQNIDAVIDNTKNFKSSLDLWIDETQFYLHKAEVKINLNADISGIATPAATVTTLPSDISTTLDTTVNLSNFNQPVTITAPANAIPATDPSQIFQ